MLTKTLHIKNVGRFHFSGAVDLARATIIYAENGRGKTTLAAVLRSLQTGEPLHILERRTIGSKEPVSVGLLASINAQNTQCTFDGQVWTATVSDCEIFDSAFIARNVYSGSEIDADHRRCLHKFVLGAANVALAKRVDDLADLIRELTEHIAMQELAIQKMCLDSMAADEFIKLKQMPDVTTAIASQQKTVEAARAAATIGQTQDFVTGGIPTFDFDSWDELLASSLAEVEAGAEARVADHVRKHLTNGGEAWLSDGLSYVRDETCPFCAGDLTGNDLIRTYRTLFSESYDDLKERVAKGESQMSASLSQAALDDARKAFQTNAALRPLWEAHGVTGPEAPDLHESELALSVAGDAYRGAFSRKRASVLDALEVRETIREERAAIQRLLAALSGYNDRVATANEEVARVKDVARASDLSEAVKQLSRLRNQRVRYEPPAVKAVDEYKRSRAAKKDLEAEKKAAKDSLDNETAALFLSYQAAINKHLANCGCGYEITGTKTVYAGGKPRTEYQLVINSQSVELGSKSAGPAFKNTLSDGDKSTLAFAFFLARLELDPKLADKILVFDDPMTSLDAHRRRYTCERIARVAKACRQIIVLTHDGLFARELWHDLGKPKKALQIAETGGKSLLKDWDIMKATQSEYFTGYDAIYDFAMDGTGDAGRAALALRVVLEGNLRMRFPTEFPPHEMLGDFMRRIKEAKQGDRLFPMQRCLTELSDLNDYSKQFHHDQNPNAGTVKPVEAEVRAYGKRVLEFAAGLP